MSKFKNLYEDLATFPRRDELGVIEFDISKLRNELNDIMPKGEILDRLDCLSK